MRRRVFHVGLIVLALLAGVGAFAVTWALKAARSEPLGTAREWLGLSHGQCQEIRDDDPEFVAEAGALARTLAANRQALAGLIAEPTSDAEAIRAAARRTLEAHHALLRRVVKHLLVVRRHADAGQCMRLKGLFSGVISGQDLPGSAAGPGQRSMGPGAGHGMGPRAGRGLGPGMGRGPQRRMCRLGSALALTPAQHEAAAERDPTFDAESVELAEQVREMHARLAAAIQDTDVPADEVQRILDELITVRETLEQRTVDYVLTIRDLLTPEQQQRLIGLSHEAGPRRHRMRGRW